MTELYVAEQYWPTGEPADSLRALMLGLMFASSQGNKEAARYVQKIWRKLTGTADSATANKQGMSAEEIKRKMTGLM